MQMKLAREVVLHLEAAGERCALSRLDEALRQELKLKSLSLSSLRYTIARQESRLLWLSEGDTPTKFFHAHANAHRCKQFIHSLEHEEQVVVQEDCKAEIVFNFFDELLGSPSSWANTINLDILDIPMMQLLGFYECFTEQVLLRVIRSMLPDKAPDADGFAAQFLQQTWEIIRPDIMRAFDAFWHSDTRSFHLISDALMILLPKKLDAPNMQEFHPISYSYFG
jgi:hypothetical protein